MFVFSVNNSSVINSIINEARHIIMLLIKAVNNTKKDFKTLGRAKKISIGLEC